ncbi:hypothetical protein QMK33_19230 [Hymenobacter sp. H14-R3]|uniref:hypothetical protein n=1 Tax=Hymenobacter sp. H14-R3 TaxID=3046308 RepID=UPI0024BAF3E2|nr:hypothetical protein [Hymenobacter sp. H14-R3]MDJ0367286.1 hypothetical protein [Hymenobacter sp. H14-R3]
MFTPLRLVRAAVALWLLCFAGSILASSCHLFSLSFALQAGLWVSGIVGFGARFYYGDAATSPLVPPLNLPALPALPALPTGGRIAVFAVVASSIFFVLPHVLRWFDPTAGGFAPDTVNAAALGAFHYFAALSMAYVSWRWIFPDLYAYAIDCMSDKLLANLTDELKNLFNDRSCDLRAVAEKRHIAQFQFLIRCVRFVFALSPFLFFLLLANHALTAALTAVPAAAPGL